MGHTIREERFLNLIYMYLLRPEKGSDAVTVRPKYILCDYMDMHEILSQTSNPCRIKARR